MHKETLKPQTDNPYYCFCPSVELQKILLDKLSRSVIIADWEYDALKYPIETAVFFKENGFEVLGCPWDRAFRNNDSWLQTIKEHHLKGGAYDMAKRRYGVQSFGNECCFCMGKRFCF